MRTRLVLLPCAILVLAIACNAPGLTSQAASTSSAPAPSTAPAASREIPSPPAPTLTYGPPPTSVPLPGGSPRIERHPAPSGYSAGALTAIPEYDPASTDPWQVDLRGADLSQLDLQPSI
jgi:hypothetical protein